MPSFSGPNLCVFVISGCLVAALFSLAFQNYTCMMHSFAFLMKIDHSLQPGGNSTLDQQPPLPTWESQVFLDHFLVIILFFFFKFYINTLKHLFKYFKSSLIFKECLLHSYFVIKRLLPLNQLIFERVVKLTFIRKDFIEVQTLAFNIVSVRFLSLDQKPISTHSLFIVYIF